jgi:GNAT superfamily N-acetyltransferase
MRARLKPRYPVGRQTNSLLVAVADSQETERCAQRGSRVNHTAVPGFSALNIRPYHVEDAARCCEIVAACLPQLDGLNDAARHFLLQKLVPDRLNSELQDMEAFVAESNGRVVGLVALHGDEAKRLYVDPPFQGHGVGRRLFAHIEELARARGLRQLHGEASPSAAPFYQSLGFRSQGSHEIERGPAVFRVLRISKVLPSPP